mgnify:CR=1 FL=1
MLHALLLELLRLIFVLSRRTIARLPPRVQKLRIARTRASQGLFEAEVASQRTAFFSSPAANKKSAPRAGALGGPMMPADCSRAPEARPVCRSRRQLNYAFERHDLVSSPVAHSRSLSCAVEAFPTPSSLWSPVTPSKASSSSAAQYFPRG